MAKKFKVGDEVLVLSGSSKGKKGKILSVNKDSVLVEKINIAKVHKKPTSSEPGKISNIEKLIHISNISHFKGSKPEKIKLVRNDDGKSFNKSRILKKSGEKI